MTARAARLSVLLERAGVQPLGPFGADPEITGATLDSRQVQPGELFFALPGARVDGADFANEAARRGAAAVVTGMPRPAWADPALAWVHVANPRRGAALLARECHGRPDETIGLVGITGTNGKTTVSYLVQAMAAADGRRAGRIGTLGYSAGDLTQPLARTTPEAPELYRLLAEMRDRGMTVVALEVSSHALALERVAGARFAVAAFLNLGRDHLDFHGDERSYFEAKALLFDGLTPAAWAVLPADGPHGAELRQRTQARVTSFGRSSAADVQLRDERCTSRGSTATLVTHDGEIAVRTPLLGRFNLDNVAAAAACALALGVPAEAIRRGAADLAQVPGRMERIDQGQPFAVLVDFAHTPAALEQLLAAGRELGTGRVIVVFGCGGERDTGKRGAMGRAASTGADLVVVTSDNPRGEDPQRIVEQVLAGVASAPGGAARGRAILDRREAIRAALGEARAEEIVLIAGKGHETRQEEGGRSRPFDDREVAADILAELGWTGGPHAHA